MMFPFTLTSGGSLIRSLTFLRVEGDLIPLDPKSGMEGVL